MVRIQKKIQNNKVYYYLEHAMRENDKVRKKTKYLGKKIPENIESLKKIFLAEIYREKWHAILNDIRDEYAHYSKIVPLSAKEKEKAEFMIKFTYNTQRIEGSALTLKETADLLEEGITPKARPLSDVKEAEAHKNLFYEMLKYKKDLSLQIVLYWHKKLLEQTKHDIAGKIRSYQVAIARSKFVPPSPIEVDLLLREFFDGYTKNKSKIHPVELAALAHLKFVTIHPFGDGNGRISRLMMNFVLHKYKYPMLDISYANRASYYNALERAQMKMNEAIFVQWFFRMYIKKYKNYIGKSKNNVGEGKYKEKAS